MITRLIGYLTAPLVLVMPLKKGTRPSRSTKPVAKRAPAPPNRRTPAKAAKGLPARKKLAVTPVEPATVAEAEAPVVMPQAPAAAPGLFSPPPSGLAETLTPNFRWFYVGGATHYELVWSVDTHFHKAQILFTNQTAAALPPEQALKPGVTYVWRVRAGNEGGWGPWSGTQTFTTPEE